MGVRDCYPEITPLDQEKAEGLEPLGLYSVYCDTDKGITAPDQERAEGPDPLLSSPIVKLSAERRDRSVLQKPLCSLRVPLVPVICIFAVLVLVVVALAVTVSLRGTHQPCPVYHYSAPCEEDWIWYRGKCYYFAETYDEWNNSQSFCVSHNASLSLIDTQEELDFLRRHKGLYDHWIGLYRDTNEPGWVWANGSMFRNTFPIVGDSPCVYLNNGHVGSAACHGDKKWICNKMDANGHMTHFY
ncbi:C-type lectin domain family 2 member D-like isoform X2 [Xenopus tropicalis]|uniref:C-type lectin domain family 2 member D-like isoform X2 n=1 Tax=Xenopus tropicalis TaxID=8364 RepID=A0A8J1JTQ1_XENTR|nr:C-type lectin domain family 2 member D-like isoform X2 [Xenopus tropicalis]